MVVFAVGMCRRMMGLLGATPPRFAELVEHGNASERVRRVMHVLGAYDRVLFGKRGTT